MSFHVLRETAFQYWAQLDCPTSLKLYLLGKADQWAEVLAAKAKPEHFNDLYPESYARANAAVTFLKKNPDVPGSNKEQRRAACLSSWKAGEASCYHANERLSRFLVSPLSGDAPAVFLRRVRLRLLEWLGTGPTDEQLQKAARHGPGTTFSSQVAAPTAADKYDEKITLTSGACWYLANIVGTKWGAIMASNYRTTLDDSLVVVAGNRFTTVPKTALTDRGIAIEGSLNIYFQLAVGSCLRRMLRRNTGWDLNTCASIHREVAKRASFDGSFATIDLSNASDSLCRNLVRVLFRGTRWLSIFEDLRSTKTEVDGKWHLLEKFSSMGNGYTFELETCIFAAICSVCLELKGESGVLGHDLFVFGDDIIVPTGCAQIVVDTLRWCGFETNSSKTFVTGSFRESCGGDFFKGHPVRGFYLKDTLSYGTQKIYTVHNGASQALDNCGVDSPWFLEWIRRHHLPERLRSVGGPRRLGDSVLHGLQQTWKWKDGIRWVKVVRWSKPITVKWSYFSIDARLACRVTGHGHTFGIDCRGVRPVVQTEWVSDS